VTDIAKPIELVYMAIDGVAPRAKMNQQRSRRYRSGKENEIESTFHGAHLLADKKKKEQSRGMQVGVDVIDDIYGVDALQLGMDESYIAEIKTLSKSQKEGEKNDGAIDESMDHKGDLLEVEPGRYTGKFDILPGQDGVSTKKAVGGDIFDLDYDEFLDMIKNKEGEILNPEENAFHSNQITPGTPFFDRCTAHLEHFVKRKLHTDPRWKNLTVVFSGPNVPGEGEHKIMDFIRKQKKRKDYDPNTRHCLFGQDGDLIMLGLATHEPHFALLREEVVFDRARKKQNQNVAEANLKRSKDQAESLEGEDDDVAGSNLSASIDSYIHNKNFDILHMSILRDYLAYEFETRDVLQDSPFELEKTIDDFVFMTFIVGNDFMPHMPAIDIADEAFDLIFYTYKRNRWKWLKDEAKGTEKKGVDKIHPYLTDSGDIVCGSRLESFFAELGKHEDPYYNNKKRSEDAELKRMRKADKKAGRDASVPPDDVLAAKEEWDRTNYKEMLINISKKEKHAVDGFKPVSSSGELFSGFEKNEQARSEKESKFQPDSNEELGEGFMTRMGTLFRNTLSTTGEKDANSSNEGGGSIFDEHYADLKGRYYHDKFSISPLDAEKHIALRKAYIEGLVWNLHYYYKGCASWEWFYPYHYGPRLSDLRDIKEYLSEISFEENVGAPLKPFEQLMACLPPSSSDLLPKPYQWLLKSEKSPIVDFYPESFTIDMNGKRWPWEAVVLLPFIDSKRLISASNEFVTMASLSEEEKSRNQLGGAVVFTKNESILQDVPALNDRPNFGEIKGCSVEKLHCNETEWKHDDISDTALRPELLPGTILPFPGFPTLKDAPVHALTRRKLGINIFGMRSRYRTAVLELDREIPMITSAKSIASKFIGTTLYFRYPFLQEGFVTAVSDVDVTVRGKESPRRWNSHESSTWILKNDTIRRQYETGEGLTGSGGWNIPESSVTLSVRPLKEIETLSDGSKVKVYARLEVEVPMVAALWSPERPDTRLSGIPAKLEKNPFKFGSQPMSSVTLKAGNKRYSKKVHEKKSDSKSNSSSRRGSVLPGFGSSMNVPLKSSKTTSLLPPLTSRRAKGSSKQFSTMPHFSHHYQMRNRPLTESYRQIHKKKLQLPSRGLRVLAVVAAACLTKVADASIMAKPLSTRCHHHSLVERIIDCRGGDRIFSETFHNGEDDSFDQNSPPVLEFAHGTTTLSFVFDDGIIAAVDSRASMGNFVGSKTTNKVLPISNTILGTMAGGAADCSFWIRKLQAEARHYEMAEDGKKISVARLSRLLSDYLYGNRHIDLSIGTMIMGFDLHGPSIYYVDNAGTRIQGDLFSVGSGSTFALGILDVERRVSMKEDEAIALGIKAIRHATFRDAYSGGYISIYVIKKDGWKKVFSEDLASSIENVIPADDLKSNI